MNSQNGLQVTRLIEHGFQKIVGLDINASGKTLVILKGPNESGKTSALRGLISALGGSRVDPEKPIMEGRTRASVTVTLSDRDGDKWMIEASWTPKSRSVTVRSINAAGELSAPIKEPQTILSRLIGSLSFNPLAFMTSKPTEQLRMLIDAAGMGEPYKQNRAERERIMEQRRLAKAALQSAETQLRETPDPCPGTKLKETTTEDLTRRLREIDEANQQIDQRQAKIDAFCRETSTLRGREDALKDEIARLQSSLAELQMRISDRAAKEEAAIKELNKAQRIDSTALTAEISRFNELNRQAKQQEQNAAIRAKHQELIFKCDRLDDEIKKCDAGLRSMLEVSSIGKHVPGLTVAADSDEILHDGIPLSQASGMRQLEVSTVIGMAANPKLKVFCIDEGDRLDKGSLDRLAAIAANNGYQIWMTCVYAGEANDESLIINMQDGTSTDAMPTALPPDAPKSTEGLEDMLNGTDKKIKTNSAKTGPAFSIEEL